MPLRADLGQTDRRMESRFNIYSLHDDLIRDLEISIIHLEISLNDLEISLILLEISLNELEISLILLETSLNRAN